MKSKKKISLHRISEVSLNISVWTVSNGQEQNFHIFVGYDDEPIIAFHQPSFIYEDSSHSFDFEDDGSDMEALNGICKKVRDTLRIAQLIKDLT